ncbi:MAG: hypothetical protein GTO45_29260 [Candidatus Aminicenantes bacterium]|nr:hypothetical protein [Candidatus Aminicenantes bacterium]NIM82882.1 hypothetical protein [Candidatus Aminicenantes bacterium]NIN22258.1 hypothetical protein [Candidatus Aminicenantes bacterium]NIN46026.1 hypothetical protein [Candidatus Aminicenantes bacterium]NIN88862.1 hypothetical protein [Candidatus Aminicenantes bacterium]
MCKKKRTFTFASALTFRQIAIVCIIFCLLVGTELISGQMNSKPEPAFRLTIKYQNGAFHLLKVKKLQMVIPVTIKEQILEEKKNPTGYFFELLNSEKKSVLRSNMPDPTTTLLEYEDPERPGHLKSKLIEHKEIVFSIIISAAPEARFIRFTRPAPGYKTLPFEKQKREELGFFDLKKKGGSK